MTGIQEVVVKFMDKLKLLWLKVVTLESADKALEILNSIQSMDDKAVLLGAVDEVWYI